MTGIHTTTHNVPHPKPNRRSIPPHRAPLLTAALAVFIATGLAAQDAPKPDPQTPAQPANGQPAPADPPAVPELRGDPIVVESASKREQELHRAPDAIGVVSREDIERKIPEDLGDAMRGQPGVYTQRTAAGQASPFIRGMTGKQVLLLVDGIRFSNAAFRSGPNQYFASLDPMFAERIEIIRGPYSVLYGSDALGGAVNVITRRPRLRDDAAFNPGLIGQSSSANRGRRGTFDLPFSLGGGEIGGYGSMSYGEYGNLMGGPSIGEQPFTSYRDLSGNGGLTWKLDSDWQADFRFAHNAKSNLFRTDRISPLVANPSLLPVDGVTGQPVGIDLVQQFPSQEDTFSSLNFHHTGSGTLASLDFDFSYHRVNEEFHRITRGSPNTRREQFFVDTTYGFTATAVLDFGSTHRITTGIDLYHDEIESGRTDRDLTTNALTPNHARAQFPDSSSYTTFGIYAQDEILLFDGALELRPGFRASLYQAEAAVSSFAATLPDVDKSFSDITGALAMVWHANDWLSPSVSIGRGFRAPNLDDLAANKNTGNGDEIPNPGLEPEVLYGAQAGAKILFENSNPDSVAPWHFRAEGFLFGHWMEDAVLRRTVSFGGNTVNQLYNGGRARIWGWEANASWYFRDDLEALGVNLDGVVGRHQTLALNGSATWNHGDDLTARVPFPRIQPFIGTLGLRLESRNWWIEPSVEVWSRADRVNPGNAGDVRFQSPWTPGFTLYHLSAGWRFGEHVTARLAVNNLGNRSYQVQGSGVFGSGTDARLSVEVRW